MVNGKLTRETLVPIGLVVAVVIAITTGAVWLNSTLQSLDFQLTALQNKVDSIQQQLEAASFDRWTGRDMKLWTELLKAKNPNLEIPSIDK
jgi:hypothetical protein